MIMLGDAMRRFAVAIWDGDLVQGKGRLTSQSGVLSNTPYVPIFDRVRTGTNPEELLASALATCFCMVLINLLNDGGFSVNRIEAKVETELDSSAKAITHAFLHLKAFIPDISHDELDEYIKAAAADCPINRSIIAELDCTYDLYNV